MCRRNPWVHGVGDAHGDSRGHFLGFGACGSVGFPERQLFPGDHRSFLEVDGSSEVGSSASGTVEPVQVSFHQRDYGDTAYGAGSTGLKSICISPALALLVMAVQELSEVNTPRARRRTIIEP